MNDLISRIEVLNIAKGFTFTFDEDRQRYMDFLNYCLETAPTIEAEPVVHGEWIECDWVKYDGHSECVHYPKEAVKCSNYNNAFKKELLWKDNFCPNCGADMRKKVE